jgi:hypothetical protein
VRPNLTPNNQQKATPLNDQNDKSGMKYGYGKDIERRLER